MKLTYQVSCYLIENSNKKLNYKNVVGDGLVESKNGSATHRVLVLDDNSRVEIPLAGTVFLFSKERHLTVLQNMETQAGRKIPTQEK